jgi:E3 ubiquitin-protein ligase RNF31
LRDFDVKALQDLLKKADISFDVEPPEAQVKAAKEKKEAGVADPPVPVEAPPPKGVVAPPPLNYVHVIDGEEIKLVCQVMLQKEGPDGLKDEECLNPAPVGMAGLCRLHYKEYLVDKINKNNLDPVELYENPSVILLREKIEVPQREDDDDEDKYRAKVVEAIKENIPLKKKKL